MRSLSSARFAKGKAVAFIGLMRSVALGLFGTVLLTVLPAQADAPLAAKPPLAVKVVVLSMFENGEPTGDKPGELQLWLERNPGLEELPFALGEYPLYYHESGLLVACLGGGIPNATASTMALGLDERFDLSSAYWLIAGIAGGDPQDLSMGSGAWAKSVVDGDLVYEVDAREIPEEWPYGFIPLGGSKPADGPQDVSTGWTLDTISFELNAALADWAYEITRTLPLMDTPAMQEFRAQFTEHPLAQRPPFITRGETLSASTYWHGEKLNAWANDWLRAYAGNDANFMTSNMEDSGTLTALHRLGRLQRVDPERLLVLRTVSNYTMPPAGRSAAWSTTADYPDGGLGALDTAQRAGQTVVNALIDNWSEYASALPEPAARIPVVFDTDMAIDDWAALLFLARHPQIELLAVTVSASGEAHCGPGVSNALAMLDLVDPHNRIPVSCGDEYPMDGYFVFPVQWQKDMDTLSGVSITPSQRKGDARHAVDLLHDVIEAAQTQVTVLATGPLTNIAQWQARFPEQADGVDRLVVMGGVVEAAGNIIVPGFTDDNPNASAEWNIYVDPVAADQVLRSTLQIELVGLDVTNHVKVTTEVAADFKRRADNPAAAFWDDILDANKWFIDSGEYYFWDVLAAMVVLDKPRFCQGGMLALASKYVVTDTPWWPTSDNSMPTETAAGDPRRHFEAATAGVLEEREGAANTLVCMQTDADAAFALFLDIMTSPTDQTSMVAGE